MSEVFVSKAALATLRLPGVVSSVNLTNLNSGIQPQGHPPPIAPQLYISIDEAGVTNPSDPKQDHLKEVHSLSIFISRRTGGVSEDRLRTVYEKLKTGLSIVERQVIAAIHANHELRVLAGELLQAEHHDETVQEFSTPLWYTGQKQTSGRSFEWSNEPPGKNPIGWIVRELGFQGCLRMQYNNSIT